MNPDQSERLGRIRYNALLAIDMIERKGPDLTRIQTNAVLGDLRRIEEEVEALLGEPDRVS
jgi:hypothetical protein